MNNKKPKYGLESTYYTAMYRPIESECRSELEIFYDATMRSLDGQIRLTPDEVEYINSTRDNGGAVINCFGIEVELCGVAA